MIVIVCPNLAVDVTLHVERLVVGSVHRSRPAQRRAGGKGVNVARALGALGERSVLVGLVGGNELPARLETETIATATVPIPQTSRECFILLQRDGIATVCNEPGPELSRNQGDEAATALIRRFEDVSPGASAVALMGSLPPGVPTSLYADLAARARERELFCLLDTSGDALAEGLAAGPSVATPNEAEAAAFWGRPIVDEASSLAAANALRGAGASLAVVTRGPEGVVFSGPDGASGALVDASAIDLRFGNPTGAGDALAAGLLAGWARGFDTTEMLRLGVASATASLAEGFGRLRARDLRPEAVRLRPSG